MKESKYLKEKNKSILFFSASSVGDYKQLRDFGIKETLVSYFYIRKGLSFYDDALKEQFDQGGLFMTDSGGFSFLGSKEITPEMKKEDYWLPYVEEYIEWLEVHKQHIFVAANLDLDRIVGRDIVNKWNDKYFKPLEKDINIVYVAHKDFDNDYGDVSGIKRLKEYCSMYQYVGVNQGWKDDVPKVYQIAAQYGTRIHGFAITELPLLKRFPMFSIDSTTWLGGVRYGTTYDYDGKNFKTLDYKKKYMRKARRMRYADAGIELEKVIGKKEDRYSINKMNLLGWMGFREEYLKFANLKLRNKTIPNYDKIRLL